MTPDLTNLQTLLYSCIAGALGATRSSDVGILPHVIRGDERLSARPRIEIYADAYFYRLLDCLKEDFPATLAVVGESAFRDLVVSYLAQHPPTEPSVFYVGRHLAEFLQGHHLEERWPFLAELARLERVIIEVFHGPDAKALTADDMRSVAPADWPGLFIRTLPAFRMLYGAWRVDDVLRAVETGTEWREPKPGPVTLVVWRPGTQVYYRQSEQPERAALEVASRGADFAAICEAFASHLDDKEPAAAINQVLARWLVDGLLVHD
jgi:hypothetical protein